MLGVDRLQHDRRRRARADYQFLPAASTAAPPRTAGRRRDRAQPSRKRSKNPACSAASPTASRRPPTATSTRSSTRSRPASTASSTRSTAAWPNGATRKSPTASASSRSPSGRASSSASFSSSIYSYVVVYFFPGSRPMPLPGPRPPIPAAGRSAKKVEFRVQRSVRRTGSPRLRARRQSELFVLDGAAGRAADPAGTMAMKPGPGELGDRRRPRLATCGRTCAVQPAGLCPECGRRCPSRRRGAKHSDGAMNGG